MAITLTYNYSEIDFRGRQLRAIYAYSGSIPARGNVLVMDSHGIPDLRDISNIRIPLKYDIVDWEIDRELGTASITARYTIPIEHRVIKGASGYTLSASSGLIRDDHGNTVNSISSQTVINNSEVNSSGWCEIGTHNYNEGSGHKTIYIDNSRPDDSGDGFSWATAKKTPSAAITLLNSQTNNLPHRLLFANGQTYDEAAATSAMTRSGASKFSKLWIGGANNGDGSTVRPIWKRNQFWFNGNYIHVHGLEFRFGSGTLGNAVLRLGTTDASDVSCQDCVSDFPQGIGGTARGRLIMNRMIFTGDNLVNPIVAGGAANYTTEATEIAIVNHKTGSSGGSGHAIYDIGMPTQSDNIKTGCRTIVQDWIILRSILRDVGRARAETQFRSMSRVINQNVGNSAVMGVGNPQTTRTCSYNHSTRTLTTSGSTTWSSQMVIWGTGTYAYANTGTNVVPGKYQISSGTGGGTTLILAGDGLGVASDGATNVSISMGEIPGRSRNQNFRHMFSILPGSFLSGQDDTYSFGIPSPTDPAGCWIRDIATTRRSSGSNPTYQGPIARTSDGDEIAIDLVVERLSLVRLNTMGNQFNYGASLYLQTGIMPHKKMLIDNISPQSQRGHARISNVETGTYNLNYNVYSNPGAAAAFIYTPLHTNNLQTFDTWKTNTGLDSDSVQIDTVELNHSSDINIYPDLSGYDGIRGNTLWAESGSLGSVERLANAIASRPLGQWDENLSPETITCWLLKQIKPTNRSVWITAISGNYDYVGAADYTLDTPTGLVVNGLTANRATLQWSPSTSVKTVGYKIKYGTDPENLLNEQNIYLYNSGLLTNLIPNTTYYYSIVSTDGWNESEESDVSSFHTSNSTRRFFKILKRSV